MLYDISFCSVYNYNIVRRSSKPYSRYNATLITTLVLISHLGLILVTIKKFASRDNFLNVWLSEFKISGTIAFIIIFFLVYVYYNDKRINDAMSKYEQLSKTTKNILGFTIMLLPTILFFILVPKA